MNDAETAGSAGGYGSDSSGSALGAGNGGASNSGASGADLGVAFAKGGKVTKNRLAGPNPKGPDDGYAALDEDEFVINAKSAKRIGYDKLHKMNKR